MNVQHGAVHQKYLNYISLEWLNKNWNTIWRKIGQLHSCLRSIFFSWYRNE